MKEPYNPATCKVSALILVAFSLAMIIDSLFWCPEGAIMWAWYLVFGAGAVTTSFSNEQEN